MAALGAVRTSLAEPDELDTISPHMKLVIGALQT
jgi:hypothetical protein